MFTVSLSDPPELRRVFLNPLEYVFPRGQAENLIGTMYGSKVKTKQMPRVELFLDNLIASFVRLVLISYAYSSVRDLSLCVIIL